MIEQHNDDPPPHGRWRTGFAAGMRRTEHVLNWYPGDGDRDISGARGIETLRLVDVEMTLDEVIAAIQLESGHPPPQALLGEVTVRGLRGWLRIGEETLRFDRIDRIVLG